MDCEECKYCLHCEKNSQCEYYVGSCQCEERTHCKENYETKLFKDFDEYIEYLKNNPYDYCNGCTQEFLDKHKITLEDYSEQNKYNVSNRCWNCWDCKVCEKCEDCESCVNCKECNECYDCKGVVNEEGLDGEYDAEYDPEEDGEWMYEIDEDEDDE